MRSTAYADIRLYAPYVNISKADIIRDGAKHSTPFEATWSCYKGGARHCGRCGHASNGAKRSIWPAFADPTDYKDADFWLQAVQTRSA